MLKEEMAYCALPGIKVYAEKISMQTGSIASHLQSFSLLVILLKRRLCRRDRNADKMLKGVSSGFNF